LRVLGLLTIGLAMQFFVGTSSAQDGSAERAQTLFNNACRTCHTLREGDNRLGPHLKGVVGRKAGSVPGYRYSSALANSDFTWDRSALDRFIASPDEITPGHNMRPYSGLSSAADRAKILDFLAAER
jgi:cytochrome c